ncbi:MAG: hypothetical protein AAGF67_07020, partial [Verrucomicrobiota bacterium]
SNLPDSEPNERSHPDRRGGQAERDPDAIKGVSKDSRSGHSIIMAKFFPLAPGTKKGGLMASFFGLIKLK